ncbi:MAG: hypothetical protein HY782_11440 [Chloroflexi bacterium]|nr:hypothetical protein [Chloroflexota bacterium]
MENQAYKLANLSDDQLKKIQEAEPTLGSINLLAFQSVALNPAQLNVSQLECLQGLEKNLGVTLVAYRK